MSKKSARYAIDFTARNNAEDRKNRKNELDHDSGGYLDHLAALRNANDGFAITIWSDAGDGEPGYKLWRTLDAKYAESETGWLCTIRGDDIMAAMRELAATGHPMKAHKP